MRIMLTSALVATTLLTACGGGSGSAGSGLFGFGKARRAAQNASTGNALIPEQSAFRRKKTDIYEGVPVQRLVEARLERVPGGAILRAKGISATLGAYDVRLVPNEVQDNARTLSYTLKAEYSKRSRPPAPQTGRELVTGVFLSDDDLLGIRNIRVSAAQNSKTLRR